MRGRGSGVGRPPARCTLRASARRQSRSAGRRPRCRHREGGGWGARGNWAAPPVKPIVKQRPCGFSCQPSYPALASPPAPSPARHREHRQATAARRRAGSVPRFVGWWGTSPHSGVLGAEKFGGRAADTSQDSSR
eukprot:scaffold254_cov71-Phaeocystis_antarctica.AAC.1